MNEVCCKESKECLGETLDKIAAVACTISATADRLDAIINGKDPCACSAENKKVEPSGFRSKSKETLALLERTAKHLESTISDIA